MGWVVNQESYGMLVLSTDWIVCSLTVGASESDEGLVALKLACNFDLKSVLPGLLKLIEGGPPGGRQDL